MKVTFTSDEGDEEGEFTANFKIEVNRWEVCRRTKSAGSQRNINTLFSPAFFVGQKVTQWTDWACQWTAACILIISSQWQPKLDAF